MLGGRHDQGIDFARRALRLHPNSAFVRMCCGWAFVFNADQDEALKQFEVAHRLSPVDPREYLLLTAVAGAHLFKRNFEEVLIWTERALERKQNAIVALRYGLLLQLTSEKWRKLRPPCSGCWCSNRILAWVV